MWKRYRPGATCALFTENAAVRTSTDATFVLTRIVPSNHVPGSIVSVENQMRTIRGGPSGAATGGDGHPWGCFRETVRFGGMGTGLDEHPASNAASAPMGTINAVKWKRPRGFRGESQDDWR